MLTTILAVALGIAVVLAVDLAGNAAVGSFRSSVETLAGDSNLEVTAAGGVPETLVGTLATLPYPLMVRPRIEDHATVADTGESVPLVGIDMVSEGAVTAPAPGMQPSALNIDQFDGVWIGSTLHRKIGETIPLLIDDHTRDYVVQGVLDPAKDAGSSQGESFVLMDIALAQRELGRIGRVDSILVRVPAEPAIEEWRSRLRESLPAGVEVRAKGTATDENRRMLAAFRWNLTVLSYIALLVGAFLIYNTISVSVVRRRPELGIVRALGASRAMVQTAFLGEAVCFGLAGALLGVPLGRVLASGAVKLVGATVQSLYVSSRPAPIELTLSSVLLAVASAAGVTLLSAFSPAREAARVAPIEAMARGRREFIARARKGRDLWVAIALVVAGAVASLAPSIGGKPLFGYLAALLFVAGSAFAMPAFTSWAASISATTLHRLFGIEALLATRSLTGSLRRTAVLVGALSAAIAMMASVGIMVGSFRQTVLIWMDGQLRADLYLRPAGGEASDQHPTLAPEVADRIEGLAGVAAVDRLRAYETSYGGLPVTLLAADTRVSERHRNSRLLSGRSPQQAYADLRGSDSVLISEPFANKHYLRAGDSITLPLGLARPAFRIADVFYDYANERGYIALDRATMLRYLPDPASSNMAVYLNPGADMAVVRAEVEKTLAGRNVLVISNRTLRTEAVRIFDRTFAITYALEAVAVVVAVMGVAGALLSLVIDRRREFGLLRFLGAATGQIRKLVLTEAALVGLLAGVAGLALGYVLSLLLIYVIDKQSFGWTIQFHWPVAVLGGALAVVYASTVLAGLYPARMAMRLNPVEVIHEE